MTPPRAQAHPQPHFGHLLKDLRDMRGLTQDQLADLAEVSGMTIRRAEAMAKCPWKRSNSIAVYRALAARQPLNERESVAYLEATGLTDLLSDIEATDLPERREVMAAVRSAISGNARFKGFLDTLPSDQARAFLLLSDILESAGAATALKLLEAMATMSDPRKRHGLPPRAGPNEMRVVSPPVQRPGFVEQTITDYEVREETPKQAPATRRRSS